MRRAEPTDVPLDVAKLDAGDRGRDVGGEGIEVEMVASTSSALSPRGRLPRSRGHAISCDTATDL